jgi:hypothetical protein
LPSEYGVSAVFNVSNLTLFDVGDDSRSNPFEERVNDKDMPNNLFEVPMWSITKARAKKLKEALNGLVQNIWSKMNLGNLGDLRRMKDNL